MLADKARIYFPDFPEYQEEAINALYDMCEGQNREVSPQQLWLEPAPQLIPSYKARIAGYTSLTTISKSMINIDKAWAQQNADVLLQLLQSGSYGSMHT